MTDVPLAGLVRANVTFASWHIRGRAATALSQMGKGALLRWGSRRGYATPGFFVSRRTCSDDVAGRDVMATLFRCDVGTAIAITDVMAREAKLLGKASEHGMRAWYVMLRMKKLFKIKEKMFYIDRSHISKRARGLSLVATRSRSTPDRIQRMRAQGGTGACAGTTPTFVPEVRHEEVFFEQRSSDHEEREVDEEADARQGDAAVSQRAGASPGSRAEIRRRSVTRGIRALPPVSRPRADLRHVQPGPLMADAREATALVESHWSAALVSMCYSRGSRSQTKAV